MYDYMYQYRGDVERIITNNKINVNVYITKLYRKGLIHANEYHTLIDYAIRKGGNKE